MSNSNAEAPNSIIDLENDDLGPVSDISFQITGKRPSSPTKYRWRVHGCRGVRLEQVLISGVWHTTVKAFVAFIRGQTQAANNARVAETGSNERDAATKRRLQAAGLLRQ